MRLLRAGSQESPRDRPFDYPGDREARAAFFLARLGARELPAGFGSW